MDAKLRDCKFKRIVSKRNFGRIYLIRPKRMIKFNKQEIASNEKMKSFFMLYLVSSLILNRM